MKKNLSAVAALLFSATLFSQVGINNNTPKATLDITAKTTDGSKPEGLIAPRLTGDQIKAADAQYGSDQKGAIIYATAAVTTASTKTANISAEGYYVFNGTVWQKITQGTTTNTLTATNGNLVSTVNGIASTPAVPVLTSASNGLTTGNGEVKLGGSLTGATTVSNMTSTNTLSFTSPNAADATITVGTPTATSGGMLFGNASHGVKRGFPTTGADNNVGLFTAGGDVYLSTNGAATGQFVLAQSTGNVGIGTATPAKKLEINNGTTAGAIKIVDGTQAAGKVLVSDANGVGTWQVNTGNQNSLYSNLACNTSSDIQLNYGQAYTLPGIGNYTCQNSGKYEIIFHSFFTTNNSAPGNRSFYFQTSKNGTLTKSEETYGYTDTTGFFNLHYPVIINAAAGDVLSFQIVPSAGAPFKVQAVHASRNNLDVIYLGL